ncbi:hypothetical protein GCM10017161_22280 [Thalassotalea marina]|uniref:Uncharacterized protein n=1 Tax=Thalassotalea marina TaxID=1673741 RepID=A0A919BJL7_9GAMM|nr:hypothetical protein GCM10017161_22280 [Thalassotalea marina]
MEMAVNSLMQKLSTHHRFTLHTLLGNTPDNNTLLELCSISIQFILPMLAYRFALTQTGNTRELTRLGSHKQ